METIIEQAHPLRSQYDKTKSLFPGYAPEGRFEHAQPVVIAHLPASAPRGYSCVISETRMPAAFFNATASDAEGHLAMTTGSGDNMGQLVHTLCLALAAGQAGLTPPSVGSAWALKKRFVAQPEGCTAGVFHSFGGTARVTTEPVAGDNNSSLTLYVQDIGLALQVAQQLSAGMLGIGRD